MDTPPEKLTAARFAHHRTQRIAPLAVLALLLATAMSLVHNRLRSGGEPATPISGVEGGLIRDAARSQIHPDLSPRDDSPTNVYLSPLVPRTYRLDTSGIHMTPCISTEESSLGNLPSLHLRLLSGNTISALSHGLNIAARRLPLGRMRQIKIRYREPLKELESVYRPLVGDSISVDTSMGQFLKSGAKPRRRLTRHRYTTPGWSQRIYRLYLQSLLEFTFPGYTNDQVESLSDNEEAGTDGAYRNITEGGLQSSAGFTERADGLLIYVPGFGDQGILLALAGGTNVSYTQMNVVDVYDIAGSTWYKQSTSGPMPDVRVSPCAVTAAAPDGSSYQIHLWGGQALLPYGNQTQYNDMWILSLPSFTWIPVDQDGQSTPYGRSGHSCSVWNGQMISVGGFVGNANLTCESPGIYVFDLSALQWVQQYTAYGVASGDLSDASATSRAGNPFNQQPAQIANATSAGGLEGSYNYTVPEAVISVIGGGPNGGATLTAPVVTASSGPLATGSAITYIVTQSGGAVVTKTASPTNSPGSNSAHDGPNIAAIVVGVICGILFIVACYLAFCAYIYRRQLQLYKRHSEMSQRRANGDDLVPIPSLLATGRSSKGSSGQQEPSVPFWMQNDSRSQTGSANRSGRHADASSGPGSHGPAGGDGYQSLRRSSDHSSVGDLMAGQEPSFGDSVARGMPVELYERHFRLRRFSMSQADCCTTEIYG
nr:kelch repeat-containing protein [Quercus suber]